MSDIDEIIAAQSIITENNIFQGVYKEREKINELINQVYKETRKENKDLNKEIFILELEARGIVIKYPKIKKLY